MNAINFEKWMQEMLIPNIPSNTVIVMDNDPYHSVQLNKPPSTQAKKKDMVDWLTTNGIPCSENMRKFELLELIDRNRPPKTYKIDQIVQLSGHTILRLPPYMCNLNPIELVWAEIKHKIRQRNISTLTYTELETAIKEIIPEISPTSWENYCKHTENIEQRYWQRDSVLETLMDNLSLNGNSDTAEENLDSSFSDD
ncbi:uncharacterized protein LOC114882418 [Osmia bicornis bicornis]|uniref:uncharacterized protein LOC114882418 n=1 Tax=Osmia bicornis bicornis TaxID=1437191 RepID=UPI0010F7F54A|nr:uncharacterized protein LOC114882418 [Osmia bicornis bicornis]